METDFLQDIKDIMGIDAHLAYKAKGKRSIEMEIITALCSAIAIEYFKGLIPLQELGERTRKKLTDLIAHFKDKDLEDIRIDETAIDETIREIENDMAEKEQNIAEAEHKVYQYLLKLGYPDAMAKDKAKRISERIFSKRS